MEKDCIFCKIARGELDSAKIWENDEFIAVLDRFPNTRGMTMLLTKEHINSYVFDMQDKLYQRYMLAAKKVAKILEKGLGVKRIAMVMEGTGVDHAHLKFYPLHGLKKKFKEIWAKERVFFKKYEGYVTTKEGPKLGTKEVEVLAKKIGKYANE